MPEPLPKRNLAPLGVLYVVKPFSVTTDSGIHGFPEGRQVKVVREENGEVVVSDGQKTARAPKDSFTNDLNVVAALNEESAKQVQKIAINTKKAEVQKIEASEKTEVYEKQQEKEEAAKSIAALEVKIAEASLKRKQLTAEYKKSKNQYTRVDPDSVPENKERLSQISDLKDQINKWEREIRELKYPSAR